MMSGMEDHRSAEGVEHLQAAARELLLAARSFLNVVEEVVEDRDRFAGAAAGVVDLLKDGLAGAMPPTSPLQPWERAAWSAGGADDTEPGTDADDDLFGDAHEEPTEPAPRRPAPAPPVTTEAIPTEPIPTEQPSSGTAPAKRAPAKRAPAKRSPAAAGGDGPPRRVRRIAVD